jgi:hypothetical protein
MDRWIDGMQTFLVAPQVMLYENKWASNDLERWMLSPPKKKKLKREIPLSVNVPPI